MYQSYRRLPSPALVAFSVPTAALLELDEDVCTSESFLKFFSGDVDAIPGFQSWSTPYALSIYGQKMISNCPFKTGNGYGDGRAISIAEIVNSSNERWEMQLKGAGTTPFCRGGDGRAVLRSSLREFVVSEAMHNLGISTTRGLSLIISQSEVVQRPWFSENKKGEVLSVDDPRLAKIPIHQRREMVDAYNNQQKSPDIMQEEACAISCRVAPSFMRVGHVELFARRYLKTKTPQAWDELRLIAEHANFREFGGPVPSPPGTVFEGPDKAALQQRMLSMLREASRRIAVLTAGWIRVGFCQGNFNSDNCLVGGRTMDYGPFGFMEIYKKNWNMWLGGGDHFSFRNQPQAGAKNFQSLAESVALLLDSTGQAEVQEIIEAHLNLAEEAENDAFRRKLGLVHWSPTTEALFRQFDNFMEEAKADYVMFWRQLAVLPEAVLTEGVVEDPSSGVPLLDEAALLGPLEGAFYERLSSGRRAQLLLLLRQWLVLLCADISAAAAAAEVVAVNVSPSPAGEGEEGRTHPGALGDAEEVKVDTSPPAPSTASSISPDTSVPVAWSGAAISASMRLASPKYVPREWMLVEAYKAASVGDYAPLRRLQEVFAHPYDEQPEHEAAFYRRTPSAAVDRGGTSFMT